MGNKKKSGPRKREKKRGLKKERNENNSQEVVNSSMEINPDTNPIGANKLEISSVNVLHAAESSSSDDIAPVADADTPVTWPAFASSPAHT